MKAPPARVGSMFADGEPHISERKKLIPVVRSDFVFAGAIVKPDRLHDRFIESRHLIGAQVLCSKQTINGTRAYACEKLALWISPSIFFGSGHVYRSGRYQRDQLVSVNWKLVRVTRVPPVVFAEPVRISSRQVADRLSVVSSRKRRSPFAGTTRYHHLTTLV